MLKRLVAGVRRRLRPRREGPVYFWWEGTCYRTRADGAVVRRQGLPIRLPDRRLLRLGDWYPIDVAIPGHVAGVDEEPARWHDADIAWRESPAGPTGSGGALALVVLGFNAAAQFAAWLNRTAAVHPELLRWSPRLLFDNSTACDPTYDALCARFGFEHGRYRNVGIAGARLEAARWALQAGLGGMLFFEDDFLFHAEPGRCRNGFQHTVPGLVGALPAIAEREGLDFLKLSFSEAMADHHVNVGWYAATDAERARDFPRATTPRLVRTLDRAGVRPQEPGAPGARVDPVRRAARLADRAPPGGGLRARRAAGMIVWRRRLPSMTLVTAILDLGRGEIAGWGRRPYALYTTGLAQLLSRYRDVPVIVHVSPEDEPLVWRTRRRDNTRVVPTTRATLGALPWYGRVDAIRTSPTWADRAEWLRESPQRLLDGYLALVLAKLRWLGDAATANPFGTERFVWMDGGLPRNPSYAHLSRRGFVRGLDVERFRVLSVPYTTNEEIHGFDRRACAQYCGTEFVSWIVRGGLFGGTAAAVAEVSELYDALLDATLAHGHLGTEETLLTILAHRHPTLFQRHCLEGNR